MAAELPDIDRLPDAPHPRETRVVYGHDGAEAEFLSAFNAGRMHSGWLLTGPEGIGKATMAYRMAAFLLADQGDQGGFFSPPPATSLEIAPDHPDMRLMLAGAHPRLFVLKRGLNDKGDGYKAQISVDEARKLKGFFQMSATDGGRRVVIVDAADELNTASANAILKVLEEPPPRTTLILIAHQPARLLPTIRSRCRVLRFHPLSLPDLSSAMAAIPDAPEADMALAVLASGSVGTALKLSVSGGAALYGDLVRLLTSLPYLDRATAQKFADKCAGKQNAAQFAFALDMMDTFLARTARAGIMGPPALEAAIGEANLMARLCRHDVAARGWATAQQELQARARHGRAVNLDPASLILDMLIRIEDTARTFAA